MQSWMCRPATWEDIQCLSPWDWRLQEYTALPVSVVRSALGRLDCLLSHIHLGQPEKSQWLGINITGNTITNSEHRNPLHQILLHGMHRKGSSWNWISSRHMEKGWWPCFQQVMEALLHPMNQWRKALCEDTAQHYSLLRDHINPLCLFSLSPWWMSSDSVHSVYPHFSSHLLTRYILKLLVVFRTLWAGRSRIKSWWGHDFLHPSRPALGPIQPPMHWVPGYSGR